MMKDAPKIKGITVELEDGRWQHFSADDLEACREFVGLCNIWRLLEFIAELSPPPAPVSKELLDGSDRTIQFEADAACESCGAIGARDYMGDVLCDQCAAIPNTEVATPEPRT